MLKIGIKKYRDNAVIPTQTKKGDAGYDLYACESATINPLSRKLIPIGIGIEIPEGYYGRIAPRSGLAVKKGIDVLAGVVDCGYRDEISVVLVNINPPDTQSNPRSVAINSLFGSPNSFSIKRGDRIAQLIIEKCHEVEWEEKDELSDSDRSLKGFGSSGV